MCKVPLLIPHRFYMMTHRDLLRNRLYKRHIICGLVTQ